MTLDLYFGIYHETFRIRGNGETFFSHRNGQVPLDRLTRFSAVGENAAHGQHHSITTEPDFALSRPPRSPLHLVPGADEEALRRRQAVRPLHLPEVRLPAYDPARTKATQPHNLVANYISFRLVGRKSKARPLGYLMGLIYFLTNEFSRGQEQED